MKLNNVFQGSTKDGIEHIFYKKFDFLDNYTVFIDLETKEKFTYAEVDINSLAPYGKSVSNNKYSSKRKVIKTYKAGKDILLHVDNLFLGNKSKIVWIPSDNISNIHTEKLIPMTVSLCKKNILFVKIDDYEYKQLDSGKIFKVKGSVELNIGDFCVDELRNAKIELNLQNDRFVTKNKALRLYYSKLKSKK